MDDDIQRAGYTLMSVQFLCAAVIVAAIGQVVLALGLYALAIAPLSMSYAVKSDGTNRRIWKLVGRWE